MTDRHNGCPGCGRDHSVPPPPPVDVDGIVRRLAARLLPSDRWDDAEPQIREVIEAERKRCADLARAEATAERNRAASYRNGRGHSRAKGEVLAEVAEEVARCLDALAQKIVTGAAPVWPSIVKPSVVKRRPF